MSFLYPLNYICARELVNISDRYRKFGYDDVYAFFQGRKSYLKGEWFGWAGHGGGNETLASVIGKNCFAKLRLNLNLNSQLSY